MNEERSKTEPEVEVEYIQVKILFQGYSKEDKFFKSSILYHLKATSMGNLKAVTLLAVFLWVTSKKWLIGFPPFIQSCKI